MKGAIYIRVSTQKQNSSHLGIEAQREICMNYIKSQNGEFIKEFQDVKSGKNRNRIGLLKAIDFCKENQCTLIFAKLDRLARDVEFTFKVINTGIDVHFCDLPQLNTMVLGVMASVAQYERERGSQRTKEALAAKKARGEKTGGACRKCDITPILEKAREASAKSRRIMAREKPANKAFWEFMEDWQVLHGKVSLDTNFKAIADKLNERGKTTSTGLPFNKNRAKAMFTSMQRIYSNN